jgi:DNA helicase IV
VALHRAAYLLYTYRRQLSTRGVLIVGPNETFLRYISQVLPSLAETGVLLRTQADLFPGVRANRHESSAAAEIKGRPEMVAVLARAVRDRQRVPDEPLHLLVDGEPLVLDPAACEHARSRARRSGKLHNDARSVFAHHIVAALTAQVAERIGTGPVRRRPAGWGRRPGDDMLLGAADSADIRAELAADPAVQAAIDWLWPVLTPQRLRADLFADADLLASAAPGLSAAERALLLRAPDGWTTADVPLLDEAVEPARGRRTGRADAVGAGATGTRGVRPGALDVMAGSRPLDVEDEADPEILLASDLLDASDLAERQALRDQLTTAQRAALDRTWAFGHIIVDEAQELSPMAWRLLMRRSPNRSMTVVGDLAQTGDLGGASSWAGCVPPVRRRPLAVDRADRQLPYAGGDHGPGGHVAHRHRSGLAAADRRCARPGWSRARSTSPTSRPGWPPWCARKLAQLGAGRLGVIVPEDRIDLAGTAISRRPWSC